ncbi:DoxX family protein [Microbacterium sp. A82]|uniref:DoxX family protein n=1 Tax=Microbacterium sp. A82 TaxID=3450452 RepID=UPI003F3A74A3
MNIALWIVAGLLAAVFLASGTVKLVLPKAKLVTAPAQGWAEDFSATAIKSIGVVEVLAASGLILPAVLSIAPVLVPLAAIGLAVVMVGAIFVHLRRGEVKSMTGNVVYLVLAVFLAWGRFGRHPFIG